MKFTLSSELTDLFPSARVGILVIENLDNTKKSANIYRILSEYTSSIFKESERLNQTKIQSWENVFTQCRIESKDVHASHKALLKRALTKGEIPSISPLVDSYNYVSLKYTLPVGGHDTDKVKSITVGKTSGKETFTPMGTSTPEKILENEFAYIDSDQKIVLTKNLVWRQCDQDKITENTTNVLIPLDDIPGNFDYEQLERIAIELGTIITSELGGTAKYSIVDKYRPVIDTNEITEIQYNPNVPKLILKKRMDVITDEEQVEEALTKGVKEIFPGKDELKKLLMSGKRIKIYTGIDPTADFIHMGHMIWMKKLSQFQKLGHEIIFLIGGFTAMIGDPDKKYTREPLTKEKVKANFENYKKDASKLLNFDWEENPVTVFNNYDWLSKINLEGWLEIMGSVTLQHILSHDMFKNRLENQTPIRLHEISYPLMQGFDSVNLQVDLEVGGSDQTFNMLTGRILSRNMLGKEKYVLTLKLLTDNSGKKMGKTTGNAISFQDSPENAYGKIMSFSDELLPLAYDLLSIKSTKEIAQLESKFKSDPMQAKKDLAFEITQLIHNEEEAAKATNYFEKTVQNNEAPEEIPEFKINQIQETDTLIDILEKTKLVESRAEAKRLVKQGGVKLNSEKISDITSKLNLNNGDVIQAGKRNWIKFI